MPVASKVVGDGEVGLLVEDAVRFHGHLGPFLVIGVLMGRVARNRLGVGGEGGRALCVNVRTPLKTPFLCVVDGIQTSAGCTVGNGRLEVEGSAGEIVAGFRLEGFRRVLWVSVRPGVAENLVETMSGGAKPEEVAVRVMRMREEELFLLEEGGV